MEPASSTTTNSGATFDAGTAPGQAPGSSCDGSALDRFFENYAFPTTSVERPSRPEASVQESSQPFRINLMEIPPDKEVRVLREVSLDSIAADGSPDVVRWIDIQGDAQSCLAQLRTLFSFDRHAIENCGQYDDRPRLEDYGRHLFVASHLLNVSEEDPQQCDAPELHTFLTPNLIVTLHSEEFSPIDEVWVETEEKCPSAREGGADLLYCRVADKILRHNEERVDVIRRRVEEIDHDVHVRDPDLDVLRQDLPQLTRLLNVAHRLVSPQMEMFSRLSNRESDAIISKAAVRRLGTISAYAAHLNSEIQGAHTGIKNIRDSVLVTSANEFSRAAVSLSMVSLGLSPVMICTSFFGQNFQSMPFGSDAVMWGSMLGSVGLSLGSLWYFWKRGWIETPKTSQSREEQARKQGRLDQ